MNTQSEMSRPLAVLIVAVYGALLWLAISFFVQRQQATQRSRRGQARFAPWRR